MDAVVHSPRVVLVHGTFARNAPWAAPGSPLCRSLRTRLGDTTSIERFQWSGENRHAARSAGAAALAATLEDALAEAPGQPLFVVGHSHGGTVITLALRDRPRLAAALAGVAFLSTPFIQLRRRPHAWALASMIAAMLFASIVAAIPVAQRVLQGFGWPGWAVGISGLVIYLGLGAALIAAIYDDAVTPEGQRTRLEVAIARLLADFEVRHLDPERTLILRANADEATAALAWVQALSRLLSDVVAVGLRWAQLILPWAAWRERQAQRERRGALYWVATLFAVAGFAALALLIIVGLLSLPADLVIWTAEMFGADLPGWLQREWPALARLHAAWAALMALFSDALIGLLRAVLVGFAALMLSCAVPLIAFGRAFGRWFFWTALFVEVSVEVAPPGRWTVHQLAPPDQTAQWASAGGASLTHSLSVEDPQAQAIVADWIDQLLRG